MAQDDSQIIPIDSSQGYDTNIVTEWSKNSQYDHELNGYCTDECKKTCVNPCPEPQKCNNDEQVKCGEKDHPEDVWPDCTKDDICIPKDCECRSPYCIYKYLIQIF